MFPRIYSREFTMGFAQRLAALRKERNLTQQALADKADMHIVQICRYETGKAEPTLEAIRKITLALHVRADALIFEDHERGPDDELRLQFEALSHFTTEEKAVARSVLESLIIKHAAHQFSRPPARTG
jgi:transcriptional regulator with XRE-family HTH domain